MSAPTAPTSTPLTLTLKEDKDFPEVFHTADKGAIRSQNWNFFFLALELSAISVAAIAQVFGQQLAPAIVNLLGLRAGNVAIFGHTYPAEEVTTSVARYALPGLLMAFAILAYAVRFCSRYHHRWLGQRALAEASKGLAWRYSMHAMHADLSAATPLTEDEAHQAFQAELGQLEQQGHDLRLAPPTPEAVELTRTMESLRLASPSLQRDAYMEDRLNDQQRWYAGKAIRFETLTTRLQLARGGMYVLAALLIVFSQVGPNGLAAATTIAGALATWLAGKRYDDLAQSYGAMARELIGLKNKAPNLTAANQGGIANQQAVWAAYVNEVETLLVGEHRDWLRSPQ